MQSQIMALKGLGFDLDVDQQMGLIFIKQFTNCDCCGGNVNLCSGPHCEALGMCVCIYSHIQDIEYQQDMKKRGLSH